MPGFPAAYCRDDAIREIAEIENALFDGAPAAPGRSGHLRGCHRVAALRLGASESSLRRRHGIPGEQGSVARRWQLEVDWAFYRAVEEPHLDAIYSTRRKDDPSSEEQIDPVGLHRLRDEIAGLRAANRELTKRLIAAEDLRAGVLGLASLPPSPVNFPARAKGKGKRETIVLVLSDLHWGENVNRRAMDGLNSYSTEIARARLGRWANAVCDLGTKHWSGLPPDRIVCVVGGDLISGAIHPELAKTDELKPLPAVRDLADHLRHAFTTIKANIDCPLDVISLPGNHGRSTIKPESKEVSATSYDMLVSDFLELSLKDRKGISFYAPESPDALFSVYGWRVLASHGDRIGSRGGQGFIGPAATAARGLKRMVADYSARGVHLDLILLCHFHCPLQLEEGFVNGSLPGPTEYSRDGRYRPHPAMQLFFTMHPHRRIAQVRWIEVGDPSEGSLYFPPADDRPLRQRFGLSLP
jgi:hypothetical protein